MRTLCGKNLAVTLIKHKPEIISNIYIMDDKNKDIIKLLDYKKISYKFIKDPYTIEKNGIHQGIWIDVEEYKYKEIKDMFQLNKLVMFDQITDPHNFGAIARTGYQLGIDGVILEENNSVSVTPTVSRISTGAVELLSVAKVTNLKKAMESFKKEGFKIYALDMNKKNIGEVKFEQKSILLLGSEDKGIRYHLKELVDDYVSIPMVGKLDSLNVSNAFAIACYEMMK